MPAADLAPLQSQQAAQHTRTGEGILQVQPIETLHEGEIGFRHRTRQVIDAAPADPQSLSLLGDRQIVLAVRQKLHLASCADFRNRLSPSARGYADVPLLRLFPAGRAALVREGEPQRAEAAQCAASGAAHRPAEASHLAVVLDALQT